MSVASSKSCPVVIRFEHSFQYDYFGVTGRFIFLFPWSTASSVTLLPVFVLSKAKNAMDLCLYEEETDLITCKRA